MKYYPQIDGLRALAVVPVMIVHCWSQILPGGGIGVDLFFVISGFVITNILLKEFDKTGGISIRDFYVRRVFRILPALIAVCAAVSAFIVMATFFDSRAGGLYKLASVAAALTSTMNWARAFDIFQGGMLAHTWSLSVEEQFYFVWPITLAFALKRGASRKTLLSWVMIAVFTIFCWRAFLLHSGADFHRVSNGTDTRADEILIGCFMALSGITGKGNLLGRLWPLPLITFLVCMASSRYNDPITYQVGYAAILISSAWLLVLARDGVTPGLRILEAKSVLWVGKRSYSLYLWHYPPAMVLHSLGHEGPVWGAIIFICSIIVADASYRFVEQPFLAMKSRLHASRKVLAQEGAL